MRPKTLYADVGDGQIAYQVVGDGPIDLVYAQGYGSAIEAYWDYRPAARVFERLASFTRLILFDRRGLGSSDPAPVESLSSWEFQAEDLDAVLRATSAEKPAIFGMGDAGLVAMMFAAANPERTRALILWNSYATNIATADYPHAMSREEFEASVDVIGRLWGSEELAAWATPGIASDPEGAAWAARASRLSATPKGVVRQMLATGQLDARAVLSSISVPTLVLCRDLPMLPVDAGRHLAEHIPGACFVPISGDDWLPWGAGADEVIDLIEEFLTGARSAPASNRVLATVLFTDIVGSTERAATLGDASWNKLLDEHDTASREAIERAGGRFVESTGDGLLATFDLPGRAVNCAFELNRATRAAGIEIRTGIHTGEVELRGEGGIGGIAVHIGARVMAEAGGGDVLCTRTVKDLTAGAGFVFEDLGPRTFKGVPDEWQVFAVRNN